MGHAIFSHDPSAAPVLADATLDIPAPHVPARPEPTPSEPTPAEPTASPAPPPEPATNDNAAPDPTPTPRHDGWTPERQRRFLETLAAFGTVSRACEETGLSREAAYGFRHRNAGAAFALGWEAAILIARGRILDTLVERAIEGQEDVSVFDPDTRERRRRWHDNRTAMSILARLDNRADNDDAPGTEARLIAQDWEAFLDLIGDGHGGAGAALFLAARRPEEPATSPDSGADGECQLRPETESEAEAEVAAKPLPPTDAFDDQGYGVWLERLPDEYHTNFPPPEEFDGEEDGNFDDFTYHRTLTDEEFTIWSARVAAKRHPRLTYANMRRENWFVEAHGEAEAHGFDAADPKFARPDMW